MAKKPSKREKRILLEERLLAEIQLLNTNASELTKTGNEKQRKAVLGRILQDYFSTLQEASVRYYSEFPSPSSSELVLAFCEMQNIAENALAHSIKTKEEESLYGYFVEGLVHFGLSRKPAIEFVREWHGKGATTIRTHHEYFRQTTLPTINALLKNEDGTMRFDGYSRRNKLNTQLIKLLEAPLPNNVIKHPKAKSTLSKLNAHVKSEKNKFKDMSHNLRGTLINDTDTIGRILPPTQIFSAY